MSVPTPQVLLIDDEQGLGHEREPVADLRDALRDEEQTEVAVLERPECRAAVRAR